MTTTSAKPPRFVRHIDRLINATDKTQRQIALEIGYERSNLISMFKQNQTRVPAEKVPALADSQLATIRRRAGDGERLEDRARRASSRPAGLAASKYPRRRAGVIGCPSK